MQLVSSYLIEKECHSKTDLEQNFDIANVEIKKWLKHKGIVLKPERKDDSIPEICSTAVYTTNSVEADHITLIEHSLEETTNTNQLFKTKLSIIKTHKKVSIYSTLSTQSLARTIAPIPILSRCPAIIRNLISNDGNWELSGVPVPNGNLIKCHGEESGSELATLLGLKGRVFPIIVISSHEDEHIWSELSNLLSYDLIGLAQVVEIDDKASWALTDILGKSQSCYLGAIRLYWPAKLQNGSIQSRIWTASQILGQDQDGEASHRLRKNIRNLVMRIAALSITQPHEIQTVTRAHIKNKIKDLEQQANNSNEFSQIAESYALENDELTRKLEQKSQELRDVLIDLENERALRSSNDLDFELHEESDTSANEVSEEVAPPVAGDIRYYKKTINTPTHDKMIMIKDCGHNNWQNASKAEKAKKGIEKLEGRSDWSIINHCAQCKGGGLWRVKW